MPFLGFPLVPLGYPWLPYDYIISPRLQKIYANEDKKNCKYTIDNNILESQMTRDNKDNYE